MTETETKPGTDLATSIREEEETEQLSVFAELERIVNLQPGTITLVGLDLRNPDMRYEDWEALGHGLGELHRWTNWAIGDWFNFGEDLFGEDEALQATEPTRADRLDVLNRRTGLDPATLANYSSQCRRIRLGVRRVELKFTVHTAVTGLDEPEQVEWLQKAVDNNWNREELRQAIKDAKNPPVDGAAPEVIDRPKSSGEVALEVLSLVAHTAQPTSDGGAFVPAETFAQVRAAVGEE